MKLVADFSFRDPAGRVWPAPTGSVINGASIPEPLWSTVGCPYTDDYRRASVVHDVACGTPGIVRKEADEMFYHACLAGGCGEMQARILYAGVRIGAWMGEGRAAQAAPGVEGAPGVGMMMAKGRIAVRKPGKPSETERQAVIAKFGKMSAELQKLPKKAGFAEFDAVIEKHLGRAGAAKAAPRVVAKKAVRRKAG